MIPELSYRALGTVLLVVVADFLIVRRRDEIATNKVFVAAYAGSVFFLALYVAIGPIFPAWIGLACTAPSIVLLWRHYRSIPLEVAAALFFFVVVPLLWFKYAWDLTKPKSISEMWGPRRKEIGLGEVERNGL